MKPPIFDPEWPADVKALYHHDMREIWDRDISRQIWNQYHNQLDVLLGFAAEAKLSQEALSVLDVGCAQGTLALKLAELGHRVVAVDLRQRFLDYARSRYTHGNIEFVVGNALELDFGRRFDLVFCNQVIEHLVYPDKLVNCLKAQLKTGGRFVITTPSFHYLKNDLPRFAEIGEPSMHEHRQFTADADGHFFAFSEEELREVLLSAGFSRIVTRFFESPLISGHMKVRLIHGLLPVAVLRTLDQLVLRSAFARYFAHQLLITGIVE